MEMIWVPKVGQKAQQKNELIFVLICDVFWANIGMDFKGQNKEKIEVQMVPTSE